MLIAVVTAVASAAAAAAADDDDDDDDDFLHYCCIATLCLKSIVHLRVCTFQYFTLVFFLLLNVR